MPKLIELTLRAKTPNEATAAAVAEVLARVLVGLDADDVQAALHVERFQVACAHHHEHDEVEP